MFNGPVSKRILLLECWRTVEGRSPHDMTDDINSGETEVPDQYRSMIGRRAFPLLLFDMTLLATFHDQFAVSTDRWSRILRTSNAATYAVSTHEVDNSKT